MPHFIAWCGFLGAWLLVAGPLDQAVREVEEQEFEHEKLNKECWELHERYEWPEWVFWALVVVMVIICIAGTRGRVLRCHSRPAVED